VKDIGQSLLSLVENHAPAAKKIQAGSNMDESSATSSNSVFEKW
jgi:hypothetical protein